MSLDKQLWMLVGGNGAGKSTFYELFLKALGLPFVNADNLAKIAYPEDPEGRSRDAAILAEAKALGYYVILVMIHLNDTNLNQARVAERVSEGGW